MSDQDQAWLDADAEDARTALSLAVQMAIASLPSGPHWIALAEEGYKFLRSRDSLHATSLLIVPGTPHPEGEPDMTTTYNLADTMAVPFTLTGLDAKLAQVPLDAGYTAAWTLADPDASGAVLTVSADTTSAEVSAGVPDTNLLLTVVVTNPDGTTINGAEAIIVLATAATTVSLVPGTPVPEA